MHHGPCEEVKVRCEAGIEITQAIREWDYGNYEGLTSATIQAQRAADGEPVPWDIWSMGCPGGESPGDITMRLDQLIADIRARFHESAIGKKRSGPSDVLVVAHGHVLRSFAARWIGKDISENPSLILEAGGVGTLR